MIFFTPPNIREHFVTDCWNSKVRCDDEFNCFKTGPNCSAKHEGNCSD